jgi:RNA polymerase sigma-70 factor (ECF subfamily)
MTALTAFKNYFDFDDKELLNLFIQGETEALAELFKRHNSKMRAVAFRVTKNNADAEDVVQNALISVMRAAHKFRGDSSVSTWLFRIVTNAAIDKLRAIKAHPVYELPFDLPLTTSEINVKDLSLDLVKALKSLPENQRNVVLLIDLAGWSIADVAQKLNCAPGTVKSRCHRAHLKLAQELQLHN